MAIYHFSAQILSRRSRTNPDGSVRPGSKAAAAAAYRSGSQVRDYRTGEIHDYSRRKGVAHSEIMIPTGAASWLEDRELLWGTVERMETRKDAQLAREFNMALPYELDPNQRLDLVRSFVQRQFVNRGMVADLALHDPVPEDGQNARNFHAHVMLSLRKATPDGLHPVKTREWNSKELLNVWRAEWALACNTALERAGKRGRVDHRTLEAQRDEAVRQKDHVRAAELNRIPEIHVGPRARQAVRHQRSPVSKAREVGAVRVRSQGKAPARRRRDYPARDYGSRLNWLERIVSANNDKLRRDLEAIHRRFDRYERKIDYWERRIAYWTEGQIRGKHFRYDRWQEAERRKKAEHAKRRFQQLVRMMKTLEDMMRLGGLQRERGLVRIRELEGWVRRVEPRKRGRSSGRRRY
ncbi:MobQ family relaxase [Roseibium aestuarii]|uniref:MobQ family relaxase n=1 Tax=Roseibium aestuarii TaxID=2600299 RepID=A0ABW4JZA9_9HYPH|nr:MobQ family relaxase [Roseibium aestuarii]